MQLCLLPLAAQWAQGLAAYSHQVGGQGSQWLLGKEQGFSSAGPLIGMHSAGSTLATIPVPILPVN